MNTYRLDIAYEGSGFGGWAIQPGRRTVQGELQDALTTLFGEPVALSVAGRTDAGVHALAQVASFRSERIAPDLLDRALNALTGPDLAIRAAEPAADGFDARRDARSRRYRYRLELGSPPSPFERGRALSWANPDSLDRGLLDGCAKALAGEHDFTAFTPTDTEHVRFRRRILEAAWSAESERILRFEVEADAFMRNMVRVLVGTMLEVGSGRRSTESFSALLEGAPRAAAGETAAAHGLYLIGVAY